MTKRLIKKSDEGDNTQQYLYPNGSSIEYDPESRTFTINQGGFGRTFYVPTHISLGTTPAEVSFSQSAPEMTYDEAKDLERRANAMGKSVRAWLPETTVTANRVTPLQIDQAYAELFLPGAVSHPEKAHDPNVTELFYKEHPEALTMTQKDYEEEEKKLKDRENELMGIAATTLVGGSAIERGAKAVGRAIGESIVNPGGLVDRIALKVAPQIIKYKPILGATTTPGMLTNAGVTSVFAANAANTLWNEGVNLETGTNAILATIPLAGIPKNLAIKSILFFNRRNLPEIEKLFSSLPKGDLVLLAQQISKGYVTDEDSFIKAYNVIKNRKNLNLGNKINTEDLTSEKYLKILADYEDALKLKKYKDIKNFPEGVFTPVLKYDNGYTLYEVSNDEKGMEAVRTLVDALYNKNANPWCLISKDPGSDLYTTRKSGDPSAWDMWKLYGLKKNGTKKYIVLDVKGKIVNFGHQTKDERKRFSNFKNEPVDNLYSILTQNGNIIHRVKLDFDNNTNISVVRKRNSGGYQISDDYLGVHGVFYVPKSKEPSDLLNYNNYVFSKHNGKLRGFTKLHPNGHTYRYDLNLRTGDTYVTDIDASKSTGNRPELRLRLKNGDTVTKYNTGAEVYKSRSSGVTIKKISPLLWLHISKDGSYYYTLSSKYGVFRFDKLLYDFEKQQWLGQTTSGHTIPLYPETNSYLDSHYDLLTSELGGFIPNSGTVEFTPGFRKGGKLIPRKFKSLKKPD